MLLGQSQPTGGTLRDHLQAAVQPGASVDPLLQVQLPRGGEFLWGAFCELSGQRQRGFGVSAIPGSEIESWQRLYGVRLSPWDIGTLRAMDRAAMAVMTEAQRRQSEVQ